MCSAHRTCFQGTYVDGAAQHRASVQGLPEDVEEVVGGLLGLVHLAHAPGEVLHGLQSAASLQRLIAPVQPETKRTVNPSGTTLPFTLG